MKLKLFDSPGVAGGFYWLTKKGSEIFFISLPEKRFLTPKTLLSLIKLDFWGLQKSPSKTAGSLDFTGFVAAMIQNGLGIDQDVFLRWYWIVALSVLVDQAMIIRTTLSRWVMCSDLSFLLKTFFCLG